MIVNPQIIDDLCQDAGEKRTQKARAYKALGRVEMLNIEYIDSNNFELRSIVIGTEQYISYISIHNGELDDVTCTCQDYYNHYGICKHTLATIMLFADNKKYNERYGENNLRNNIKKPVNDTQYRNFKQMVNTFYNEEIEGISEEEQELKNKGTVHIEPQIMYDRFLGDIKVEFKIGNKRMYKIKNLAEFYTRMLDKEFYRYGEKLQFIHTKEMFDEESQKILDFLLKYAEIIKYANSNSNSNYRYYGKALSETSILVGNTGLDDLFEILKGKSVEFKRDYLTQNIELVDENPNITFTLNQMANGQYAIVPNIEVFNITILKGKDYKYILDDKKIYRCSKEFENTNLRLLEFFRQNYMNEVILGENELTQLFSIVLPKVKKAINIDNIPEEEIKKYKPKELVVKVYLDFDENDYLVADVLFCYDNNEFNPLDEKIKLDFPRNVVQETKALNMFRKTGFMLDTKNLRFILPDNDKIYEFLAEDVNIYMKKFEVLVTESFKSKQIGQAKMENIGVQVENNLLEMDLKNLDIDIKELQKIMEKYQLKKKYYRLKDGSFLNLEENNEIDFLDKLVTGMDIDYKELEEGEVRLPAYRSLYLNKLLKNKTGIQVTKNSEYKEIVNSLDKEHLEDEIIIPEKFDKILRYYQKTGFKWLKILDSYKFGGILADDMGLGKTIQMLAVIVDYIENARKNNKEEKRASLVVSPSSLTLNWLNEANKFASDLNILVIRGTLAERKRQIKEIQNYDLVITSYDLLKRDIELYKDKNYQFRYIIADEAQYLKNSNTQNAKAIKKINADTRYALTGTPIENSLAELWSIFDYIMPGYLFTYKKFKTMYETPIVKENSEKDMAKLRMLIEPFVLRRNKKEVLTELPDKTVTVLNNEMGEEQRNIYLTYLLHAKDDLLQEIQINGYEKSHMQILAALTRLRQICCHPSLFIKDYKEGSSKLDQCMEIVQDAIEGGHKILLFSGYTSMFPIIEKELQKNKVNYYKLTGSTKVEERIKMVDKFNNNPDIKIFLISLKAGGTGLNLTGADMVIHYDPWWNISTENQATDRAYRIGQKNNVQVYKLITKNSIEEKIYELQQKKSQLVDNMLSTKTSFINKLSKEEIMNLFN